MPQRVSGPPPKKPAKTNAFKPRDPLTAPFKITRAQGKTVKEIRRRQDSKTASEMAASVGARHGLTTPSSPFRGAAPAHAPAHDKDVRDLTAKVELAKAQRERLQNGGLLNPAQAKREKAAAKAVTSNVDQSTFHERKDLGSLAAPAVSRVLQPMPKAPPQRQLTQPPRSSEAKPAVGGKGTLGHYHVKPLDIAGGLGKAVEGFDTGLGTGMSVLGAIPGTLFTPPHPGATHTPIENVKPTSTAKVIGGLTTVGLPPVSGKVRVAAGDVNDVLHGGVHGATAEAAGPKDYSAEQAAAIGFTPEYSAKLMAMALKRGWYKGELRGLVGMDLMQHAYADPPHGVLGTAGRAATNFGRGAAQTAAFATGVAGLAGEIASGHGQRALGQLGSDLKQQGAEWLEHPLESAVADPFSVVPAVGAAGKTAGLLGHVTSLGKEMGLREIPTGMSRRVLDEGELGPTAPLTLNRGEYSRNWWTASGQHLSDKLVRLNAAHGHHFDQLIRRSVNENAHDHVVRQRAYKAALGKLEGGKSLGGKKKRAEILLAYLHAGGKPEQILEHYDALAAKEGGAAASQAAFLRDHVIPGTQHLSEADHAFVDAARELSLHTSNTHVELGRFGHAAVLYRQLEPLIRSAAEKGDHDAQVILDLRERVLRPPAEPTAARSMVTRGGKLAEAEQTLKSAQAEVDKHTKTLAEPKPKRPAKGSGAEAQAAWREKNAAWHERQKVAKGKLSVAERQLKDRESRLGDLHEADRAQVDRVPDPAVAAAEYASALAEFAQRHTDEGGIMPARIQYTKPPLRSVKRYTPGTRRYSGARTKGALAPRQKASTGETFASGNYLIDANSPLRESNHAMRLRTALGAHRLLIDHLAQEVPAGTAIPKGFVAVSKRSFGALSRARHDLDQESVSMASHEGESTIRNRFAGDVEKTLLSGDKVDEAAYLIPKGAWDRQMLYTKPESLTKYDKAMRGYQRQLISLYPGTVLGNSLGSVPLALASGAGGRSAALAARTMKPGGANRELAPHSLFGHGPSGPLAAEAHNPASAYMNMMRSASIYGEDYSRVMAYWGKAAPIIRKESKRLGVTFDEYARDFAMGKHDPVVLDRVLDHVERFLGDTLKPTTGAGKALGKAVLFPQWVTHMAKLVLYTLPVKHPRRMLFLNTVAEYGDQYRQEHGAWPAWMTGFFPLFHETSKIPGIDKLPGGAEVQHWSHVFSLNQLNPQATAGGLMQTLTEDRPLAERIAGVTGPTYQYPITLASQLAQNERERDPSKKIDAGRTALADALPYIPFESKANPRTGQTADSLPWAMRYKTYPNPLTGQLLSPFLNPGARPDMGLSGFLERLVGFGGYQVPNEGPINNKAISSQAFYNRPTPAADASARRKAAHRKALQSDAAKARNGP